MSIPQVPSQLKRGPAEALRAAFAGIGKILMAADRPSQATAPESRPADPAGRAAGPDERRHRKASARGSRAGGTPAAVPRFRSLDQTGNVRLLTPEELADQVARRPPAASEPPLPGYDGLSLASIRARLRGLDVPRLRTLVEYEAANAKRAEVVAMLERRIRKLESGQ